MPMASVFSRMAKKAVLEELAEAGVLQEIQLAMLSSGAENKVEEAKAASKANNDWFFIYFLQRSWA